MRLFRIHRPPSSNNASLDVWLNQLTDAINALPAFSLSSTTAGPESYVTGDSGTLLFDVGSSASTLWFKQSGSTTVGWGQVHVGALSASMLTNGNLPYAQLPTGSGSWDAGAASVTTLTRTLVVAGQLIGKGTAAADAAATGYIGELASSDVTSGGSVALTNGVVANVTSISLSAGDWQLWGVVNFAANGASSSDFKGGIHTASATMGADNTWANIPLVATGLSDVLSVVVPAQRVSVSATTTVYLVASASFSLGSVGAYGRIQARRMR